MQLLAVFAILVSSTHSLAATSTADVTAKDGAAPVELEARSFEASQFDSEKEAAQSETEEDRPIQASLELRRLADFKPRPVSRPKGIFTLLGATALLSHAAYIVHKTFNTIPFRAPWISLGVGGARFDTSNMAIYSLVAGLILLFAGVKRRWASHLQRKRERIDDLVLQDQIRQQYLKNRRN